ncbi:hypothetical protein EDE04_0732 [Streptomyces sp. 2132.2]|uniref:hypothetical protein n=1 Tax=Streptomyces sp. 2132.2 TaxID=2485161 RepID=UPI000FB06690|nr:hypothetical protein [Streptomyces sp. 2132.2]ROQ94314.1 hypothetical protein EDE04_0732 [Streptomyces sp. 2132.2]
MTAPGHPERAVSDPIGLIADLVAAIEHQLEPDRIRSVVAIVAGGRSKSRLLAAHLTEHPRVLNDGRSPAPRAVGDLLIAPREAGAQTVSPPCCAECGRQIRTLQRRGQDWYCRNCGRHQPEPCAAGGNTRRVASRDRAGRPRCGKCPDGDGRDPIAVIGALIAEPDPQAEQEAVSEAIRRSSTRPSYQRKLAWALESHPALLTGDGHLAPHRAILKLIDLLHEAGIAGIVRPSCPGCHRVVRIDKPLGGKARCSPGATYRHTAGHFVRWVRTNKLATVHVPAVRWNGPTRPLDDEHRWNAACRLLHDDTLKPEERLAGLLLLLYAQGPSAIHRRPSRTSRPALRKYISVSAMPPFSCPRRSPHWPVWLPPSARVTRPSAPWPRLHGSSPGGQPGRPISTTQLTQRLNQLGIRPGQARSTALFQLATEIPAAILARTLGIHTDVAAAWQRLSAGYWASCAAEVSSRNTTIKESSP